MQQDNIQTVKTQPSVHEPRQTRIGFLKGLADLPSDFDIDKIMADEVAAMFESKHR